MRNWARILAVGFVVAGLSQAARAEDYNHRIGGGINYWATASDVEEDVTLEDIEDSGYSGYVSYQYWPSLIGAEFQIEATNQWITEGNAYAPQVYLLIGGWLYGGVGVGMTSVDGEWADSPFYALKAGLNLKILPHLYLDISGNYRVAESEEIAGEEIDTDSITLGVGLRFGF